MKSRNKDIHKKRIMMKMLRLNLESPFSVTSDDYLDELPSSKKKSLLT